MEKIINSFIENIHNGIPIAIGHSERIIPEDVVQDMLGAFLLCFAEIRYLMLWVFIRKLRRMYFFQCFYRFIKIMKKRGIM